MSVLADAWHRLAAVDAAIEAATPARATLDPARLRAHTLLEVWSGLCHADAVSGLAAPLADGLAAIAEAALAAFPGNVFWDFDFIAADLLGRARVEGAGGEALIAALSSRIAGLHRLYGGRTAIRFRYVHDFVYGFDWAKWVRREPSARASLGPHDPAFLDHMERRGGELLELIASDDATYPRLRDERHRNPFPFSREPADEYRLHRELARRGQIPVEAWRMDARPEWRRDHAELRRACARSIGLDHADDGE